MSKLALVALVLAGCVSDELGARRAALETASVAPSQTDGLPDCADGAIGCEDTWDRAEAIDSPHMLTWSLAHRTSGKLLLFLPGGDGNSADRYQLICDVAAERGYHVILLTYPAAGPNGCRDDLDCYEGRLTERLTGEDCGADCDDVDIQDHRQDSVYRRLVAVLEWAVGVYPDDGWDRYLDDATGEVIWPMVNIAGFSNGSSHAGVLGVMNQDIARVALIGGPNDGGGDRESEWQPAGYVHVTPGITDVRYFGLVHERNKGEQPDADGLNPGYQVILNYAAFGMAEEPYNPPPFELHPEFGGTDDFGNVHVIVSFDEETLDQDAHNSVINDFHCDEHADLENPTHCTHPTDRIGYEDAWRCLLGTGDEDVGGAPAADAGADQIVECGHGGGADVELDGGGSTDPDCDVLAHTWTGPFGDATGKRPTVFVPLGTSPIDLEVSDEWSTSDPDTTLVTVADTQPPVLTVTLTPTSVWPPNHRMVQIDATVEITDACGEGPVAVVLTSLTSDQPDDGLGDGHTEGDVQGADLGTFDRTFLVRSERAGGEQGGRTYTATYTATDASGNETVTVATVRVPHSQSGH